MSAQKVLLLNPGPVVLNRRVRQALLSDDLCHREPEFLALQGEVKERLQRVYAEAVPDYVPLLLTGSGTSAVEAMVGTLVPRRAADGDGTAPTALVMVNGVYGRRMATMLERQAKPFRTVETPWDAPLDLAQCERVLAAEPTIRHVLAVHHETTTGRLNDIDALGRLCQSRDVALLLDSVSSFGAEEIRFAPWNLEACAATANKCLHGVAGVAFVLARRTALVQRPSAATSLYLDLHAYAQTGAAGYPPFTPAVQVLYALREALAEFEDGGGWQGRRDHYRRLGSRVREGLAGVGLQPFLGQDAPYSCVLTSYPLPSGLSYADLHDRLKAAGIVIYAGQGPLADVLFRISTMGDLDEGDADRIVAQISNIVRGPEVGS